VEKQTRPDRNRPGLFYLPRPITRFLVGHTVTESRPIGGGPLKDMIMAPVVGLIVGVIFRMLKLPLPAPPVLPGILGIVGIFLGGLLADRLLVWWK